MHEPYFDYCGVRIGTAGISLIGHGHGSTLVRKEIQLIQLRQGFTSERPTIQFLVGASLVGWAAWLLVGLFDDLVAGNGISANPRAGSPFSDSSVRCSRCPPSVADRIWKFTPYSARSSSHFRSHSNRQLGPSQGAAPLRNTATTSSRPRRE